MAELIFQNPGRENWTLDSKIFFDEKTIKDYVNVFCDVTTLHTMFTSYQKVKTYYIDHLIWSTLCHKYHIYNTLYQEPFHTKSDLNE